jgi:hypothetical protein
MGTTWPPEPFDIAFDRYRELDAWWSGDTKTLSDIYSGKTPETTHTVNGREYHGGIVGRLTKWWWGQPAARRGPVHPVRGSAVR